LGFRAGNCKTTFSIEKTEWYVGEPIKVQISCDNTNCHKPVKNFKVKLFRTHSGRA